MGLLGAVMGSRVIAVRIVVRAGLPLEVPREGGGGFIFGPGLGFIVVEGSEWAWVLGFTYARFLGPSPNPWLKDGVGGGQVPSEEA